MLQLLLVYHAMFNVETDHSTRRTELKENGEKLYSVQQHAGTHSIFFAQQMLHDI